MIKHIKVAVIAGLLLVLGACVTTTNEPKSKINVQDALEANVKLGMQLLQQEVLQLRGMVEEQAHELKRLKQQRLDDYLDLDRRLSKVGQGDFTGTKTTLTDIRSTAESAAAASAGAPEIGRAHV